MPHGTCRTCVREERLLREVFGFVTDALCGTLLTWSFPALLVALLFGWLDHDLSWAVKWALTVLGPSATALYWIFLKIHRMNITGRKTSGGQSTLLVFLGAGVLIALMLYTEVYNLRD